MRVLRVIGSMNPSTGGPCQGIRNSIVELAKLGVYNEVVCLDSPDSAYLNNDPLTIHAIGPGKGPWHYTTNLQPWLINRLPDFDVVIVHGLWLYLSYATLLAQRTIKKRAVLSPELNIPKLFIMPHGMLDPYFQRASSRKLKALRNWIYWKFIEHKVVSEADGIVFTCETELLLARDTFRPYRPKREINIGYGIAEPPPLTPAMLSTFWEKCPTLADSPYLLFLSRINHKKGVDLLIHAYKALLAEQTTGTKLPKLVIAGPGLDSPYGRQMQKQVAENPELSSAILFPGMLMGEAKWGAFYGCEAFVLPSHQENFGIAVVEALACGKPVLISDQVNIWREIAQAGAGIIGKNTPAGTLKILTEWLSKSRQEKSEMAQQASATFARYFEVRSAAIQFKQAIDNSRQFSL